MSTPTARFQRWGWNTSGFRCLFVERVANLTSEEREEDSWSQRKRELHDGAADLCSKREFSAEDRLPYNERGYDCKLRDRLS